MEFGKSNEGGAAFQRFALKTYALFRFVRSLFQALSLFLERHMQNSSTNSSLCFAL